jgi:hypothetical protein
MNANCNEVLGNWGFIKGDQMVKSAFSILAVAAIGGIALTPVAASAATAGPAVLAHSSSPSAPDPGPPENTTVIFTVSSGALSLTAPASVNLGTNAPGTTLAGTLGTVTVTDNRALLAAAWTAVASSTSWTTGGGTPAETIPAGDVGYDPGSIATTGTITATGTPITLSGTLAPVVTGTNGVGDNTATWNPAISVAVPASAVGGTYTGTVTQSVSLVPPSFEVRAGAQPGPVTKGRTCAARSAS